MKNVIILIFAVACSLTELVSAQTSNLQGIIRESVESYIKYRDSVDIEIDKRLGLQTTDRNNWKRYVLPELIGADNLFFSCNFESDGVPLVWVTKKRDVKRLLKKKRSDDYSWYYRVSINIEDDEFVVYVMTGFQRKVGETLQGRFSYGLKDGSLSLHTVDYQWTDIKQTYNNPNIGKVMASHILEDMISLWKEDSITRKTFSDTVDVLQSITNWRDSYLPEMSATSFTYLTFLSTRILSTRVNPFLSIDCTFNQQGELLVYFRTIYCQKQKGKYKQLQQHCSWALVFTLSPDINGKYKITSYKRIDEIKSI